MTARRLATKLLRAEQKSPPVLTHHKSATVKGSELKPHHNLFTHTRLFLSLACSFAPRPVVCLYPRTSGLPLPFRSCLDRKGRQHFGVVTVLVMWKQPALKEEKLIKLTQNSCVQIHSELERIWQSHRRDRK